MKALLGLITLTAALSLNAQVSDSSSELTVQSSSDLRVAVVDSTRTGNDRGLLHEAFAASLGTSMSKKAGGKVTVKVTEVDAFRLAFDLKAGMYDAVFIVGNNLPPSVKKGDYEVLRAVSDVGAPARVFHMVVPSEDPSLRKMVSASFPEALNTPRFQEAVARSVAIKINADALRKAIDSSVVDTTATR